MNQTTTMEQATSVEHPMFKAMTALLVGIGVSSWADFAQMVAALYTVLLVGEWIWKHSIRGFCERRGWVKRLRRRREDTIDERS